MSITIISALLLALFVYVGIGFAIGRKTKGVADLLPLISDREARIESSAEFSTSTVATTISLATVVMALFELSQYLGLWLLWTALTTVMGLLVVRMFAERIWLRMSVYDHKPTLHEFLGSEFNSTVLLRIGAVCTSLGFLGAIAVELMVGARFFAGLIPGVPPWIVVVVLCAASFLYTAVGGFRAVIITDRLQMISIWLLLFCLPVFYIYYVATHGGLTAGLNRMPTGILDFSYTPEVLSFIIGIFFINVPTFIADMSIWQRIAGCQKGQTVTAGLGRSALSAAFTWGLLALLACFVFMIVSPVPNVNPLVSLVGTIGNTKGILAAVILFVSVIGLYGTMLSTASTQLIAVSHALYADIFLRSPHGHPHNGLESRRELSISRAILVLAAILSTILVELLTLAGFSIADLVFAIYGAQLGLCPLALSAIIWDRSKLKKLSAWAAAAVSAGFIAGWVVALYGRFTRNTDLIFLSPVFSLTLSLLLLTAGLAWNKIVGNMNIVLLRSVMKARQNGLYRFKQIKGPVRLDCLKDKCAKCCNVIGTPVVTPLEAKIIGSDLLVEGKGAIFIKSDGCTCTLLKQGLCSIYPRRPKGCREYPWYNIDGKLFYDSGCPGLKFDFDKHLNIDEIQPFNNFFPNTPRFIVRLIKSICIIKT